MIPEEGLLLVRRSMRVGYLHRSQNLRPMPVLLLLGETASLSLYLA